MEPSEIMQDMAERDSNRIKNIREILNSGAFSDRCKLYEIKKIINAAMVDFIESRRKIDTNFLLDKPVEKFLLNEDF